MKILAFVNRYIEICVCQFDDYSIDFSDLLLASWNRKILLMVL